MAGVIIVIMAVMTLYLLYLLVKARDIENLILFNVLVAILLIKVI